MEQNQIENLKKYFFKLIDDWVEETLDAIIDKKPVNRGLWDRFKGGLSNLFYGRDNKNNPYYNLNRFGDALGSQASEEKETRKEHKSQRISLKGYLEIKNCVESTEFFLNEALDSSTENLQIVKSIRQAAQNLKQKLSNVIDSILPSAAAASAAAEPAAAAAAAEPAAAVAAAEPAAASAAAEPASGADETEAAENEKRTIKWFEDAINSKEKNDLDALRPRKNWLRKGTVLSSRLPRVVAWMSLRTHTDPLDIESIKNELNRPDVLDGAVKSILPAIAPKGPNALVNYMRKWFVSNEENEEKVNSQFNLLVDKLTRQTGIEDEAKVKSDAEAKVKSDAEAKVKSDAEAKVKSDAEAKVKSDAEAQSRANSISMKDFDRLTNSSSSSSLTNGNEIEDSSGKTEKSKIKSGLTFLSSGSTREEALSKAGYRDDLTSDEKIAAMKRADKILKEEIIKKIQKKLILPLFKHLSNDTDRDKLTGWWKKFVESMESEEQTIDSLKSFINSETIIEEILNNSDKWSKNKIISRLLINKILSSLDQ